MPSAFTTKNEKAQDTELKRHTDGSLLTMISNLKGVKLPIAFTYGMNVMKYELSDVFRPGTALEHTNEFVWRFGPEGHVCESPNSDENKAKEPRNPRKNEATDLVCRIVHKR